MTDEQFAKLLNVAIRSHNLLKESNELLKENNQLLKENNQISSSHTLWFRDIFSAIFVADAKNRSESEGNGSTPLYNFEMGLYHVENILKKFYNGGK